MNRTKQKTRVRRQSPEYPPLATLAITHKADTALTRSLTEHLMAMVTDEEHVTPYGRAMICGALVRIGSALNVNKAQAIDDLATAARDVLSGIPPQARTQ